MLERVSILNLKRRSDKWYFAVGALMALNFPLERLNRFIAHDGLDYADIDGIVRAAELDGFDLSCKYLDCINTGKKDGYERQLMATNWSYCSVLRHINEQNRLHIWMLDEFFPQYYWAWDRLSVWAKIVMEEYGSNRIVCQLARSNRMNYPRFEDYKAQEWRHNVGEGFCSAQDGAFLLNAAGADFFLQRFLAPPHGCILRTTRAFLKEKPSGLFHAIEPIFESSRYKWRSDRHITTAEQGR